MTNNTAAQILLGKDIGSDNGEQVFFNPKMANRHGIIAGATGTGKTVSLKIMAEAFSRLGVPVFMSDAKGDLSGMAAAGLDHPKVQERIDRIGITDFDYSDFPTVFWDLLGEQGHPVRTTISEMGPLLLSRLLAQNDTQSDILTLVFQIADKEGHLLLDLKDLKAMVQYAGENAKELSDEYGRITAASTNAIVRDLAALEADGGDQFFGEPALNLFDFLRTNHDGRGLIHVLAADKLILKPKLYATFLLWMLSELFETLPEVGDLDKPRLVLFFDEAHLLFDDMPDALIDKIRQVILLIRSKGVGLYFVTQNPADIHEDVRGQLGNRILHALRTFSPKEQKALKAVANSFPSNPSFDAEEVIPNLGVGEALVSTLDDKGLPTPGQKVLIVPPRSHFAPVSAEKRQDVLTKSPFFGQYDREIDRESAFERLMERKSELKEAAEKQLAEEKAEKAEKQAARKTGGGRQRQGIMEAMMKSAVRSIGSRLGREIIRGVLGSISGRR